MKIYSIFWKFTFVFFLNVLYNGFIFENSWNSHDHVNELKWYVASFILVIINRVYSEFDFEKKYQHFLSMYITRALSLSSSIPDQCEWVKWRASEWKKISKKNDKRKNKFELSFGYTGIMIQWASVCCCNCHDRSRFRSIPNISCFTFTHIVRL